LAITFFSVQLERDFIKKAKTTFAALSVAVGAHAIFGVWIKCREYLPDSGS
jgi:hypothetical protein